MPYIPPDNERRTAHIALLVETLKTAQEDNDEDFIASALKAIEDDADMLFQVMKAIGRTPPE